MFLYLWLLCTHVLCFHRCFYIRVFLFQLFFVIMPVCFSHSVKSLCLSFSLYPPLFLSSTVSFSLRYYLTSCFVSSLSLAVCLFPLSHNHSKTQNLCLISINSLYFPFPYKKCFHIIYHRIDLSIAISISFYSHVFSGYLSFVVV